MKKEYHIGVVNMAMEANGYPKGFILKREPTVREAMHILRNILGFNLSLCLEDFDTEEERKEYRNDCQKSLTKFLRGDMDWTYLCNDTYCYDDDEMGFPMASAFPMAAYLKQKGIIE